jgi:hypothetical protein
MDHGMESNCQHTAPSDDHFTGRITNPGIADMCSTYLLAGTQLLAVSFTAICFDRKTAAADLTFSLKLSIAAQLTVRLKTRVL